MWRFVQSVTKISHCVWPTSLSHSPLFQHHISDVYIDTDNQNKRQLRPNMLHGNSPTGRFTSDPVSTKRKIKFRWEGKLMAPLWILCPIISTPHPTRPTPMCASTPLFCSSWSVLKKNLTPEGRKIGCNDTGGIGDFTAYQYNQWCH